MFLQLQRLLVDDPAFRGRRVLVDVGALLRFEREAGGPAGSVMSDLEVLLTRTRERLVLFVGPTPTNSPTVSELAGVAGTLARHAQRHDIVRSSTPLVPNLPGMLVDRAGLLLVTAGLADRPHELAPLEAAVDAILDSGSGGLETPGDAFLEDVEPVALPDMAILAGVPIDGLKGLATREAQAHIPGIQARLTGESGDPIPARLAKLVDAKKMLARVRGKALRGSKDPVTQAQLMTLIAPPRPAAVTCVFATTDRDAAGDRRLTSLAIRSPGGDTWIPLKCPSQDAAEAALRQLHREEPDLWVAPRALDLFRWMIQADLPLPKSVIDPGIAAFVIDPVDAEADVDLARHAPSCAFLRSEIVSWMGDHRRRVPAPRSLVEPTEERVRFIQRLPGIVDELRAAARAAEVETLLLDDIGRTLPVAARIESQGIPLLGPPDQTWSAVETRLQVILDSLEAKAPTLDRDESIYRASFSTLINADVPFLQAKAPARYGRGLNAKEIFERVAVLDPGAAAMLDARSTAKGILDWVRVVRDSGVERLRGDQFLLVTGRLGIRALHLHAIPKKNPHAQHLLSRVGAPQGRTLIGVDYNAFEARVLAALSGDPVLLAAAQDPGGDVHAHVATQLFPNSSTVANTRDQAKAFIYAIAYGQGIRGFWKAQSAMDVADAKALYQHGSTLLHVALSLKQQHGAGLIVTRGGWRRQATTGRKAINTLVQGTAAHIFRWVLRRLDEVLPEHDARVIHQEHDGVLIDAPQGRTGQLEGAIKTVMEDEAAQALSLPFPLHLRVKIKKGATWASVI